MASTLSSLVNNLADRIHKINCKYEHDDRKCETCRITSTDCNCFLEYINFKDYLEEQRCLCCNNNYQKRFDENLKKRFFLIHANFLTMISIRQFYCWEKVFTHMNIWVIGKNLMNILTRIRRFLQSPKYGRWRLNASKKSS